MFKRVSYLKEMSLSKTSSEIHSFKKGTHLFGASTRPVFGLKKRIRISLESFLESTIHLMIKELLNTNI